jgi:hypothetical protein
MVCKTTSFTFEEHVIMIRHPDNSNLTLHYDNTFGECPVMAEKGPFIREYLQTLHTTMLRALDDHPRTFAFRFDLRLPTDKPLPDDAYTNWVIYRFIESLKAKIWNDRATASQQYGRAHDTRVRYVWAREIGEGGRPHHHFLMLLNQDAYHRVGRFNSEQDNMFNRLQEAWASALELDVADVAGLVEIPKNGTFYLARGDEQAFAHAFHRASYFCKVATKQYGQGCHCFGSSRV